MTEKLVRDYIPKIIAANGERSTTRILSEEEYKIALDVKLQEEVAEYLEANDTTELADVIEVIFAIAKARGLTLMELEAMRLEKRTQRGGFDERISLQMDN